MAVASTRRSSGPVIRSLSPVGRFYSPNQRTTASASASASAFASSTSGFSTSSHTILHRSTSPNRVNLFNNSSPGASSIRFSLDRSTSPNRSINHVVVQQQNHRIHRHQNHHHQNQKKSCLCSPTTHPGSFRCSLHKNNTSASSRATSSSSSSYGSSNQLNMRRSAMTNSLVRIGTVEGDLVKRALAALIRPSSHQQRRRADFQRRPSRLSVMSKADGGS
ncbi:paxillin-B [Capsicum chacoense]